MYRNKIVPTFGALISIFASSACQPIDGIEDRCIRFAKLFKSVAVNLSSLDSDYLTKPLPDTLRRLEAGYDSSCAIGGVADIYIQCLVGDNSQPHNIIHSAPIIRTDPEGFTVVIISIEDYENLSEQDLFWASCDSGT